MVFQDDKRKSISQRQSSMYLLHCFVSFYFVYQLLLYNKHVCWKTKVRSHSESKRGFKVGLCTMKAKEDYHFLLKHTEPSDMFLLCFPMQGLILFYSNDAHNIIRNHKGNIETIVKMTSRWPKHTFLITQTQFRKYLIYF